MAEKNQSLGQVPVMQITEMLNQLLDEKRIEFSRQDVEFKLEDLSNVIDKKIFCKLDDLARIVSNLINNSIEAMNSDHKVVKVSLVLIHSKLELSVVDNGTGFSSKVFSKIGKSRISTKQDSVNNSGAGIGLVDAREKIHKCNAGFHFENLQPNGAKVALTFDLLE